MFTLLRSLLLASLVAACGQSKDKKAAPAPTVVQGAWKDPISGLNWVLTGTKSVFDGAPMLCGDWKVPKPATLKKAVYDGLLRGFQLPTTTNADYAWTDDEDMTTGQATAIIVSAQTGSPGREVTLAKTSQAYVYCCQ